MLVRTTVTRNRLTDIKQLGHDYNRDGIGPAKSQAHGGQSLQMQVSADMKNKLRALAGDPELRRMPVAWSVNASPGGKASGITAARRGSVLTSMPQANLLVEPKVPELDPMGSPNGFILYCH